MAKIQYETKVSNGGATTDGIFYSANANEIKTSVNALYDDVLAIDGDLTTESAARVSGDETNATAIANEAITRGNADASLQSGIASKAPINSPTFTGTVAGITKGMVALGSVDDTSDLDKAISTAQGVVNDLKEDTSNKQTDLTASATKYPTVNAVNIGLALKAKNFIKSNESLAGASRKDDVLYGIVDQYTGEELTLSKVTGTPTVDNIIFFQLGSEFFKRNIPSSVNPKWFGAKGDSTTNDTVNLQKAINSYNVVELNSEDIYLITTRLIFSKENQIIIGNNASIKYNGLVGERIADVTANNTYFKEVVFDGNLKQQNYSLVYVADNVKELAFTKCTFKNVRGTEYGTTAKNCSYGLMISPYGCSNFNITECTFKNIKKHNDTPIVGTPTAGYGFCGGIFIFNGVEPTATQTAPTGGVISNCVFEDILTVLDSGLSLSNSIELNDADGVRFYGNPTGASKFPISIQNCSFLNVSKRAIKMGGGGSTKGIIVENINVVANNLMYGMTSVIKVDDDSVVKNIVATVPIDKEIVTFIQIQGDVNINIENVSVNYCSSGILLNTTDTSKTVNNIYIKKAEINSFSSVGFGQLSTVVASNKNVVVTDSFFNAKTGVVNARCVEYGIATDETANITINNTSFLNGDVKIVGSGATLNNVNLKISEPLFTGSTSSRSLIEVGKNNFAKTSINGLFIEVGNITVNYLNASRSFLFLYGDYCQFKNIFFKTTNSQNIGFSYAKYDVKNTEVENFLTDMIGTIEVKAQNTTFRNFNRTPTVVTSSSTFLYMDDVSAVNVLIDGVFDTSVSTSPTIRIDNGTGIVISNVQSRTTGSIIQDSAITPTALKTNISNFFTQENISPNISIISTTTPLTKSSLNTTYPTAKKGFTIIQDGANQTYIKKDDSTNGEWSVFTSVQLT